LQLKYQGIPNVKNLISSAIKKDSSYNYLGNLNDTEINNITTPTASVKFDIFKT
jgi:hypothetical protein